MRIVVVVGTTGSGKTTVARELAARLGGPHIERSTQETRRWLEEKSQGRADP